MKVGFIGTGNMGGALAKAVSRAGAEVWLFDKDVKKAELLSEKIGAGVGTLEKIAECDFVFLGVKPNIIPHAAKELSSALRDNTPCVISMAAGVCIAKIEGALEKDLPVIRIMPNTPAAYGEGMILYTASEKVARETENAFLEIMNKSGRLDAIPERLIDAASAISGCGPAFAYMFIEALADGGVAAGLPREKALQYASQMLLGAAKAQLVSGQHPGQMKDAVCSPGGSTIEGVMALENGGFRGTVSDAVLAAYEKTVKLGK
jgi:pyrroline-5-carboxylate reductase